MTSKTVAGTAVLEVSHEALIREWPRLASWLHEAREDILLQQTISEDVKAGKNGASKRPPVSWVATGGSASLGQTQQSKQERTGLSASQYSEGVSGLASVC